MKWMHITDETLPTDPEDRFLVDLVKQSFKTTYDQIECRTDRRL